VEDYRDAFYPTVSNIDGREQFELLLRGDIGLPAIGRKAILRRMTRCFSARELCRGCKTLPWLEAREAAPAFTGAAPVDLAGLVAGEPLRGPCWRCLEVGD
jgi:hypothetical protein